jgi:decaprenyl-phosphate phosphoribosyltransferase
MARGIIKTLRPRQWVKNVFVLAPLFFSRSYMDPELLGLGLLAALLFSFMAGCVYIINDVLDVEKDRNHPTKCMRPIPSGQLPIKAAMGAAGVLGAATLCGAWLWNGQVAATLTTYFVLNLAYSIKLKHVAYLDVLIISTGFVLRVMAGALAIDVFLSEWLLLCTFLLTLYLGLGKRLHELKLLEQGKSKKTRPVLERYHKDGVSFAALFIAGLTIASYTIYTLTAALPQQPLRSQHTPFSSPWLLATIPCTVFGITRFHTLLNSESPESPTDQILKDRVFILNIFIWIGLMVFVALSHV